MKNQSFYIAICDDDVADVKHIGQVTAKVCMAQDIPFEICTFKNAGELLTKIQEGEIYDLLLLDVMMPGMDGMALARELRKKKMENAIVFISSNREMAMEGYEVAAVRYLGKPLKEDKLKESILFCYEQCQNSRELLLPTENGMRKVSPKEIYYIEIVGRKSRICQQKEAWDTKLSMRELEKNLLMHGFVRCHQSFLVNCSHVRVFHTSSMELTDGRSIPVSKHRIKEVRQRFFDYMRK